MLLCLFSNYLKMLCVINNMINISNQMDTKNIYLLYCLNNIHLNNSNIYKSIIIVILKIFLISMFHISEWTKIQSMIQ